MITRWPEQRKNDLSQRHVRKRPVSTEAAFVKSNSAIGRLNSTSALRHGHIAPVLTGSPPPVQVLFADALVRDGFAAVAILTSKAA